MEGVEERGPVGVAMDLRLERGDVLFRGESGGGPVSGGSWESVEMAVGIVFVDCEVE